MAQSYRFTVTGRVQGVFFRQSTRQIADTLGLDGWVRNRADGAVEGVVGGRNAESLESFRQWLHSGPDRAVVNHVAWESTDDSDLPRPFAVRR